MEAALPFIALALRLLPQLVQLGLDIVPLVNRMIDAISGNKPITEADWIALHTTEDMLRRRLHTDPIPLTAAAPRRGKRK